MQQSITSRNVNMHSAQRQSGGIRHMQLLALAHRKQKKKKKGFSFKNNNNCVFKLQQKRKQPTIHSVRVTEQLTTLIQHTVRARHVVLKLLNKTKRAHYIL